MVRAATASEDSLRGGTACEEDKRKHKDKRHKISATLTTRECGTVHTNLDSSGQLTFGWLEPISAGEYTIPPGQCNLYTYPFVTVGSEVFVPDSLKPLNSCLFAALDDPSCGYFEMPDEVGAFFIHALLIANNVEALDLAWQLIQARPSLLCMQHVDRRDGQGVFSGESCLHVVAANRHEKLLVKMLDLAERELTNDQFETLLRAQTHGSFFDEAPMRFYGSTILAYACVFSHRRAVRRLLATRIVSLNAHSDACVVTGLLPIHIVVANNLTGMYKFLTRDLPGYEQADPFIVTRCGRLEAELHTQSLTALQVAAQLGRHRIFKYILRKQAAILWKWGPVTQYTIDLSDIDSANGGSGDVMQLVARENALRGTQEMLLDSFMFGFLYKLYVQKWKRFGWKIHYARRVLDMALLVVLVVLSFRLKASLTNDGLRPLVYAAFILIGVSIGEELRCAKLFYIDVLQIEPDQRQGKRTWTGRQGRRESLRATISFCRLHMLHVLLAAHFLACSACTIILTTPLVPERTGSNRTAQDIYVYLGEEYVYRDQSEAAGVVWLLLSFSILLLSLYNASTLFTPFEKLNIFLLSTARMLKHDLAVFMVLYGWLGVTMLIALYIIYPTASGRLPIAPAFSNLFEAGFSLLSLTLTATMAQVHLDQELFEELTNAQKLDMAVFGLLYFGYVVLSVILLLNLLIAMMAYTFADLRLESTLECRVAFAQVVVRHELVASSFGMNVNVGDRDSGRHCFRFRTVDRDSEGRYNEGANDSDPFADAMVHEDGDDDRAADRRRSRESREALSTEDRELALMNSVREEVSAVLRKELQGWHLHPDLQSHGYASPPTPSNEPTGEAAGAVLRSTRPQIKFAISPSGAPTNQHQASVLDRADAGMRPATSPSKPSKRVLPNLPADQPLTCDVHPHREPPSPPAVEAAPSTNAAPASDAVNTSCQGKEL